MDKSSLTIVGNYPVVPRVRTGLYSFDMAVSNRGQIGLPLRSIVELYGYPNVGKSSLAYYLASKTGNEQVTICDLEQLDRDYIEIAFSMAGFNKVVRIADTTDSKGKPITHEKMLTQLAEDLYYDRVGSVILDSVGAIQPIAEAGGDFGEAFMGKRAKLVAQVSRSLSSALRNKAVPSVAFVINHVHSVMGGRGHNTAGGETLKYLAAVRIMLWTEEIWKETSESDSNIIGFLSAGQVEKLRFGGRGRKFRFYIVPGYGVHVGATAMFDCFELGLAEQGATVKIGGKSLGYIRKDLLSYAVDGRQRKFAPFLEEISKHEDKSRKEKKNVNED